jgi:hypothetical protein
MVRAASVAAPAGRVVLAVADALRGDVYAGAFRFESGRVLTELEPGVWRPDALAGLELAPEVVAGEVPPPVAAVLERWAGRGIVGPPAGAPHARALIGLAGVEGGAVPVEDAQSWEPVYGRPAEAQARWEMAHGRSLPDSVGGAR